MTSHMYVLLYIYRVSHKYDTPADHRSRVNQAVFLDVRVDTCFMLLLIACVQTTTTGDTIEAALIQLLVQILDLIYTCFILDLYVTL